MSESKLLNKAEVEALIKDLSNWVPDDWHTERGPLSHFKERELRAAATIAALQRRVFLLEAATSRGRPAPTHEERE